MSGSYKPSSSQKAFLSPTDVAELTAAAVAALPSSLSQANLALAANKSSSTHRAENGDIVHHHQSTHRGGNATLVTSTTTTIHHHMGGSGGSAVNSGKGVPLLGSVGSGAAAPLPPQQQFALHSHGHHHHHHHLAHGASLLANGSLSGLANGSLVGSGALDGALGGAGSLVASASFQGDLNKIDLGLNSEDADVQLEAAKKLRVLLS
ncbi:hypothetical protein BBJ28_00018170, partial [Nothophytophthora sp. Chile5]